MKKTMQFFLFTVSACIILAYQNCSQAPSGFGEFNSFEGGDDGSPNLGSYNMIIGNTMQLVDGSSSIVVSGQCSVGLAADTSISWSLRLSSSYNGLKEGIASGCRSGTFSFEIPLDTDSFDYQSSNYLDLIYTVVGEDGSEGSKSTSINLLESMKSEDTATIDCSYSGSIGSVSSTPKECVMGPSDLLRSTRGYSGFVMEFDVTPRTQKIDKNDEALLLFSLVDHSNKPYFSYFSKQITDDTRYISDGVKVYRNFYNTSVDYEDVMAGTRVHAKENDDDFEDGEYHWQSGVKYSVKIEYFYTGQGFWAIGAPGYIGINICEAANDDVCPVSNFNVRSQFLTSPMGLTGFKVVFGEHNILNTHINGDWHHPTNWLIDIKRVKRCGSEFLTPELQNGGYCE